MTLLHVLRPETPPPVETRERTGSVRGRTQSIEEQMTVSQDGEGGASQRSNILSRISKMGQSMLPVGASPGSQSVASEEDMVCRCFGFLSLGGEFSGDTNPLSLLIVATG